MYFSSSYSVIVLSLSFSSFNELLLFCEEEVLSFSFLWLKTTSCEYSRGRKKSQLARSPRFIFARQNNALLSLSFLLFHNFASSVSTDDDDASTASSSASSSFCSSMSRSSRWCATSARVGRFDDGRKMSSSSSSSSSTRRRRGGKRCFVAAKGGEGQIVVIGANGKTGKRCVKYAAENGGTSSRQLGTGVFHL